MIRATCVLSIIATALDCVLAALGERSGVFVASFSWVYWIMSLALMACAARVAVWGSE